MGDSALHSRRHLVWWAFALWGALIVYIGVDVTRYLALCRQNARTAWAKPAAPWEVSQREAIVVLTGDGGRIPRAVELLRERGSPLLLVSGAGRGITKRDLVNQQGDAATHIHETWEKILIESRSTTTVENAKEAAQLLSRLYKDRVILVTSDYHMPRALRIFQILFPSVNYFPYPAPSEVSYFWSEDTPPTTGSYWKLFVEYWKYFLFVHAYQFTL